MSRTNPELVTKAGESNFARLQVIAKQHNLGADKVAQRFCLEGAIRRVFTSEHALRFGVASLKGGALIFLSEGVDPIRGRATSDIDIQIDGFTGTMEELTAILKDVLATVPENDDGVRFDVEGLKVTKTRDGGIPGGSVTCLAQVGRTVVKFKCDVGFYAPEHSETLVEDDYPSLLPGQLAPVHIKKQPIEYAVVDKINAAVRHAGSSTRHRDYYDLHVYCTRCRIDDEKLLAAFQHSWELFGDGPLETFDTIENYSDHYAARNASTWDAMRAAWVVDVPDLQTVITTIRERLAPIVDRAATPTLGAAA